MISTIINNALEAHKRRDFAHDELLDDIGMDHLHRACISMDLEDELGIRLRNECERWETIGDIYATVEKARRAA